MTNSSKLIKRADGRIEVLCEHGIGHTVKIPKEYEGASKEVRDAWWSHGCCNMKSCCSKGKHLNNWVGYI